MRVPVSYDPSTRTLTVGTKSTVVPETRDGNEAMLRGYLALVAQARGTTVSSLTELRQADIEVLAELLDLDDVDLEARFVRLLGMSREVARSTRRRIAKHRALLAAAGVTVTLFVSTGVAAASGSATGHARAGSSIGAANVAPAAVSMALSAASHATPPSAPPTPPAPTTPPPQPPALNNSHALAHAPASDQTPSPSDDHTASGEVEIGDALVIERGTPPDDPNVQIGDSVTYER